jgi:hypothetical protein
MVFDAICMPQNWVGSEIMEIMEVPYQRIREDADGILEQLGGWMRYRTKKEIPFELDTLEREFHKIMNPSTTPSATPSTTPSAKHSEEPCMIRIPTTFVAPPPSFPRKQHQNHRLPNRKSAPLQITIPSR